MTNSVRPTIQLLKWSALLACLFAVISCGSLPGAPGSPAAAVKTGAKGTLESTEPPQICMLAQSARVPVIMYHDLIERRDRRSMWYDCTVDEFREQMQTIKDKGEQPITLQQLYEHLTKGDPVPPSAIVLTFDDNYQSFHDRALPVLREFGYPSAVFVHTGFVGSSKGRPKMTWDELKELAKSKDVTIGSHTITHPSDITQIPSDQQTKELVESKKKLEDELGVPIPFLAYPDGKNDATVRDLTQQAGYKMAFSVENCLAEESPDLYAIGRYVHTRLKKAIDDQARTVEAGPTSVFQKDFTDAPVTKTVSSFAGIDLALITGGRPSSMRTTGRKGVREFVEEASAVAGINGTFFNMVTISGMDNGMVGPCRPSNEPAFVPDPLTDRLTKLRNRPLVIWNSKRLSIVPFQPGTMNTESPFKQFMPDYTDAFLGGGWIVHEGIARTDEQIGAFAARDYMDARHRAFFGLMNDGKVVLGASLNSVGTEQLARAAAEAGCQEAVLLDSGFSTSLIYGEQILASGHSTKDMPSRPVPHAIVLKGELADPTAMTRNDVALNTDPKPSRRHRRRHRARSSSAAPL